MTIFFYSKCVFFNRSNPLLRKTQTLDLSHSGSILYNREISSLSVTFRTHKISKIEQQSIMPLYVFFLLSKWASNIKFTTSKQPWLENPMLIVGHFRLDRDQSGDSVTFRDRPYEEVCFKTNNNQALSTFSKEKGWEISSQH